MNCVCVCAREFLLHFISKSKRAFMATLGKCVVVKYFPVILCYQTVVVITILSCIKDLTVHVLFIK